MPRSVDLGDERSESATEKLCKNRLEMIEDRGGKEIAVNRVAQWTAQGRRGIPYSAEGQ